MTKPRDFLSRTSPAQRTIAALLAALTATLSAPMGSAWSADASTDTRAAAASALTVAATSTSVNFDGVVQAVRETVIAAQVSGAVVALNVKAGDRVRRGQILLRLDAHAAEQNAAASAAQVRAARAAQEAATRELERQKQLHQKKYISDAALERAEAQYKSATAGTEAQVAAASAAQTQSGFYVVKAPYDGVVSDVSVVLGDMAMPGRPLMTVYDPAALRVSVPVPQSIAAKLSKTQALQVEFPAAGLGAVSVQRWEMLPHVDPATHTIELRLPLPSGTIVVPGAFARVMLPVEGVGQSRIFVAESAVVRRAEMTGVYVIGGDGRPQLRQVRVGRREGGRIEILSGLGGTEQVVSDPASATKAR